VDIGKHWKTIFDTLQDGLMIIDVEGNILAANPAAERLTGYTADELIGSNCRILNCTGCELYGRGSGKDWCSLFEKGEVRAKKCLITKKNLRAAHVLKNASVLYDSDGEMIGSIETLTDISELIQQQQEIESLRKSCRLNSSKMSLKRRRRY
jgi:PAS domain S-box-containing protein